MTEATIKNLIFAQSLASGIKIDDKAITDVINLAGPFVWKAYGWRFRRKEILVDTTGDQEYVELPGDFGGFYGFRYRGGTSKGWQLEYHDEDTFEYAFPNPNLISNDVPKRVKVVRDADSGAWRAYFNPEPDATYSLTLIYLMEYGGLTAFPQGFEGALIAACWLFLYAVGTPAWAGAYAGYKEMVQNAIQNLDPINRAEPGQTRQAWRFYSLEGDYVPDNWYTITDGSDY